MQLQRAHSVFTIKSVDEDQRIITGVATTPTPDRYGDVVEPKGAEFNLPLPLLWQHNSSQPVGNVLSAKVSKDGIEVKVQIAKIAEPGKLKERLDEAWQSVKAKLVRGFSIGFSALESARIEGTFGIRFLKWEWLELSLVTIPANVDCTVQTIKMYDDQQRAASGHRADIVRLNPPGATGRTQPQGGQPQVKTLAEQIAAFEAKRAASAERMKSIVDKASEEGRTLDETEAQEYDDLAAEVKSVDEHLVRLKALEKTNVARATPIDTTTVRTVEGGSAARGGVVQIARNGLPKGTAFTRYVQALARSKGNLMQAVEIAKHWKDSTPEVELVLRAAVAAGTTTDTDWAAPLVPYQEMISEFVELLRPATIVGRLTLRRVPFNIRIPRQTQGSTVGWVGEAKPKPVGELKFDDITLRFTKLAGIVVISDELARLSTPSAEMIIRDDLIKQIAQFLDQDFVDPDKVEVANVSPASITYGVTPVTASGTDVAALRTDIKTMFSAFISANLGLADGVWITTPTIALGISMMQNPLGQPEFPGITMNGGVLLGLPVITSESVRTDSNGGMLILAKQSDILLADDGGVTIDVSREASLQMNSTPDDPATASTVMVSLWQQNLVGIRAERWINWKKRRDSAVAYIDGANYGGVIS